MIVPALQGAFSSECVLKLTKLSYIPEEACAQLFQTAYYVTVVLTYLKSKAVGPAHSTAQYKPYCRLFGELYMQDGVMILLQPDA